MIWSVGSTVLGAAIIVYGLVDIFLTLLHPHARGRMTRGIVSGVWHLTSGLGPRARAASGPLATLAVVLAWAIAQTLGWAFVYLPHIPQGFLYNEGIDPDRYVDFFEAVYISLVALSTVGFGEVIPTEPIIRILTPVQAVMGFALLTASATWLLQLFPTLGRRRSIALSLTILGRAGYPERLREMDPASAATVVLGVAQQIAEVRVDLSQSPESYYFREGEAPTSLGRALPVAVTLAREARASSSIDLVTAGTMLDDALEDLGACLRDNFGAHGESRADFIDSFARDHA
ncbi:potassium channel family protein [Microbacterium sp.]|uniref:potassium channel family protein n=1 Tax=Microbacterium sp. TaxID=51671 RepID=UPI0037C8B2B5